MQLTYLIRTKLTWMLVRVYSPAGAAGQLRVLHCTDKDQSKLYTVTTTELSITQGIGSLYE